ncbi:MAG: FecR domain-containing protein [Nodosilinea sp.]
MGLVSLVATVLVGLPAEASVPLTRADVEALRNRVEFIPRGRTPRAARRSDILAVGDALRTAATAQADLRFNDGSLARVGERATFQFQPNTRNFRLSNGTLLLLVPPGRGRTNIQTPSAVTGIQGSAVVVRYIPESDLTLVMALTNNPAGPMTITASGCAEAGADCATTEYSLYGGQMALIQNNQVQVVEFDLPMFYQTSPLVEGLELDNPDAESPLGAVLEQVRAETLEALEEQSPFSEESVILNPAAIGLSGADPVASEQPWMLSPSGNGVSPLSPLSGVLTPGNSLVTTIPPQSGAGAGVGNVPSPGGAPVPTLPTPETGFDPTPVDPPGNVPAPTPNPTPAPTPNQPTLPPPETGFDPTPVDPPDNTPPRPTDPAPSQPPGNGPPAGGPGNGPPGGDGPGNAAPPPFSGGVPANPPAEPEPFFPPDK